MCISHSVCPTLCGPTDYSLPACSSVHGLLQAKIMERVAIPLSRGSSQPRNQIWVSYVAGRFFMSEPCRKPPSCLSKRKLYGNDLGHKQEGKEGDVLQLLPHCFFYPCFILIKKKKSQERDSNWLSSSHMLTSGFYRWWKERSMGRVSRTLSTSKVDSTLEGTKIWLIRKKGNSPKGKSKCW